MFTASGIKHCRCFIPQSVNIVIAFEDGRNYLSKHVELIEIINKIIIVPFGWLFILLNFAFVCLVQDRPIRLVEGETRCYNCTGMLCNLD